MIQFILTLLGVAAATAVLMPLVIRALARYAVWDVPGHRSSHRSSTIRGGGLAFVLPSLVGWALFCGLSPARTLASTIALGSFAALGFLDDLGGLGVKARLLVQLLLAVIVALSVSTYLLIFLIGPILVVSVVNAFNFMDGINGISGITLVCAGLAFGLQASYLDSGQLGALSAVAAGSGLGFLPFNVPTARVFLGDVGSYFGGAVLGVCALLSLEAGANVVTALAPLAIYGADTFTTLVRRIRRGDDWSEAHREHTYQQLVDQLGSHGKTAVAVGAATVLTAGVGLIALGDSFPRLALSTVLVAVSVGAYLSLPRVWVHE